MDKSIDWEKRWTLILNILLAVYVLAFWVYGCFCFVEGRVICAPHEEMLSPWDGWVYAPNLQWYEYHGGLFVGVFLLLLGVSSRNWRNDRSIRNVVVAVLCVVVAVGMSLIIDFADVWNVHEACAFMKEDRILMITHKYVVESMWIYGILIYLVAMPVLDLWSFLGHTGLNNRKKLLIVILMVLLGAFGGYSVVRVLGWICTLIPYILSGNAFEVGQQSGIVVSILWAFLAMGTIILYGLGRNAIIKGLENDKMRRQKQKQAEETKEHEVVDLNDISKVANMSSVPNHDKDPCKENFFIRLWNKKELD